MCEIKSYQILTTMNQSKSNSYKDKISGILDNINVRLEVEENNNASLEEIKNPQDCEKGDYRDKRIETLSEELATVRKALRACGVEIHRKNRVILEKTIEQAMIIPRTRRTASAENGVQT